MSELVKAAYEQARARVGVVERVALGKVNKLDFQRFAVAYGDRNPLFFDDEFARRQGYAGAVAPPLFLSSVMDFGPGQPEETLRADGTTGRETVAMPIEGLRLMGAGQELEFHHPAGAGVEVTMEVSLEAVDLKEGRSGAFLVIRLQRRYLDSEQRLLLVCRENFIAR